VKNVRNTEYKLLMCFSYCGEDFELSESKRPSAHKQHAKKVTRRTRRRHDRALEKSVED
jgi:hypothetical protein